MKKLLTILIGTVLMIFGCKPENDFVIGVQLDQTQLRLSVGEPGTAVLTATVLPETAAARDISWQTTDDAVVFVSPTGNNTAEVRAVGAGTATVSVTTQEGGFTAVCAVTVEAPLSAIRLNIDRLYLPEGTSQGLTVSRVGNNPEEPLPDLLTQAYYLLGKDWQVLYQAWQEAGAVVPPVMITVANRTETAARIKYAFDHHRIPVPELCVPELTVHIDSKTMDEAEGTAAPDPNDADGDGGMRKLSRAEAAAILRETVDTVGQRGKRGEQIRNVISVGMLSEGWDAKTVTHILGLRAFSSQLLCEQVVGRGLRRTSYDLAEGSDMFTAEYVNIFGIPFTFLPHESDETGTAPTTPPKTQVESLRDRMSYEISWPNIIRIDREFKPKLSVDLNKIDTLTLEAADTRLRADLAPIIDGKTDLTKCTEIDLQKLDAELRMQRIVFEASGQVYDLMKSSWKSEGTKYALLGQVIRLVEEYLKSGAIVINPPLFNTDPVRQRIIYMMNMNKIVQHLWGFIKLEQTERIVPIFDQNKRVRSTNDMPTWFTSKPCFITQHSQISHCVFDSAWEATESYVLEKNPHVTAWAKNDHLGFEILYVFDGVVRKYTPDFLVKLDNGKTLVLETKGQETRRDKEKRKALAEWVAAVNQCGEFGEWCNDVSYSVADVEGIIVRHL